MLTTFVEARVDRYLSSKRWDFPLISSSAFLWYFLSLFACLSYTYSSMFVCLFQFFVVPCHPHKFSIPLLYALSSQWPLLSLLKTFMTSFYKEKYRICLWAVVNKCQLLSTTYILYFILLTAVPFASFSFLIILQPQLYPKMEIALTKNSLNSYTQWSLFTPYPTRAIISF